MVGSGPTPSALTKRELDSRGWPWTQGEHYQHMGDPGSRAKREALLWCRARVVALAEACRSPSWAVTRWLEDLAAELEAQMPPEPKGPPGVKRDLYGFGDLLVLDGEPGALLIQATSRDNVAARLRKIREIPEARRWLAAGNRIEVWGWGLAAVDEPQKPLIRGARKPRQEMALRVVRLTLAEVSHPRPA